jgi:heat shock protein HslJ
MLARFNGSAVSLLLLCSLGCTRGDPANSARMASPGDLVGTAWRLDQVAGTPALEGIDATLEFPEAGKVTGKASCNHFFAAVKISGASILISALGATKMACAEAVNHQEVSYLSALQVAERFELDSNALRIYFTGGTAPLSFVHQSAGLTLDDPTGMWTIVGHRAPGESAMSTAQAEAWTGRTIQYGITEAIAGSDTCVAPTYQHRLAPADSLLSFNYRISPASLGLPTSTEMRLGMTEVSCDGKPWMALGGILLQTTDDRAFAVQDGVFFELQRAEH